MSVDDVGKSPHGDGLLGQIIRFVMYVIDDPGRTRRLTWLAVVLALLLGGGWPALDALVQAVTE